MLEVYGYPGDTNYGFPSDARYQYTTGETITSVGDRYFRNIPDGLLVDLVVVQSLWTSDNYIVGIHFGLVWNTPTGVRITQEMIDIIRSLS